MDGECSTPPVLTLSLSDVFAAAVRTMLRSCSNGVVDYESFDAVLGLVRRKLEDSRRSLVSDNDKEVATLIQALQDQCRELRKVRNQLVRCETEVHALLKGINQPSS